MKVTTFSIVSSKFQGKMLTWLSIYSFKRYPSVVWYENSTQRLQTLCLPSPILPIYCHFCYITFHCLHSYFKHQGQYATELITFLLLYMFFKKIFLKLIISSFFLYLIFYSCIPNSSCLILQHSILHLSMLFPHKHKGDLSVHWCAGASSYQLGRANC